MGIMGAEESVALLNAVENIESAPGAGGRRAELLELPVHPIHEEHLLVEFGCAGRNDIVECVALAQFLEFGIAEGVEFESLCVIILDEGQRVEARQSRAAPGDGESVALLENLGRAREDRCIRE